MTTKNIHNILIIFALYIISCAQPATPTGGEKDTQAPTLTETSIPAYKTSTKPSKITFVFDENIQVKNTTGDITISPYISKQTTIKSSNKKIEITINPDSLYENTTYSINLNESVSDLNENNIGTYEPLLFSTGLKIDSQKINVSIHPIEKLKKTNLHIQANNFLYPNINYSTISKSNNASLFGLKQYPHQVIVFNDENGNSVLDSIESIGYQILDSISNDTVSLFLYSQKKSSITAYKINDYYFATGIEPFTFNFVKLPNLSVIKDTIFSDSTTIYNLIQSLPNNHYIVPKTFETKSPYVSHFVADTDTSNTWLKVQFNSDVVSILKDSFKIIGKNGDTIPSGGFICELDKNMLLIKTQKAFQKIILPSLSITTQLGNNTKIIDINATKYCSLAFHNKNTTPLVGNISNTTINNHFIIEANSRMNILVPCGTYSAIFFSDNDDNHYITPPNIKKQYPGEPVIIIDQIETSSKLSNEIILKHRE